MYTLNPMHGPDGYGKLHHGACLLAHSSRRCRLWYQKLEQEAGGMVDSLLRETNQQVNYDLALQ